MAGALNPYKSDATSKLMKERDVPSLLMRIILTEQVDRVSLAGMVDLLRAGGSFRDVNGNDVTSFDQVMGTLVLKYHFLGSSRLNVVDLGKLIRAFEPGKPTAFVAVALE